VYLMSEVLHLNENTIKKINYYASELARDSCDGFSNSPSDIKDFKEKVRRNLLISVEELMAEGYDDEEALNISLKRFGEVNEVLDGMKRLCNIRCVFKKWLLKVTILLGVIGLILQVGGAHWEQKRRLSEEKDILNIVHSNIETIDNPVTKETGEKLESMFKSTVFIKAIGIKKFGSKDKAQYCYLYPKNTKVKNNEMELKGNFIFEQGNSIDYFKIPNTDDAVCITLKSNHFSDGFYIFAKILLIGYWILFALWSSVEVIYDGKANEWIILFIFFNFIGYLIYRLVDQIANDKTCLE